MRREGSPGGVKEMELEEEVVAMVYPDSGERVME